MCLRTLHRLALSLILAAALTGCDGDASDLPVEVSFDAVVTPFQIVDDGPDTFVLQPVGQSAPYYPLNLPAAYQQSNLRVRVTGLKIREYKVLLQTPLKIYSISAIPQ